MLTLRLSSICRVMVSVANLVIVPRRLLSAGFPAELESFASGSAVAVVASLGIGGAAEVLRRIAL